MHRWFTVAIRRRFKLTTPDGRGHLGASGRLLLGEAAHGAAAYHEIHGVEAGKGLSH